MTEVEPPEPRLVRRVRRLARWRTPPPRWRGLILFVAAAVFVVGIVLSFQRLDVDLGDIVWWPLVVLGLVGTPLTIGVNAAELRAMARCLDPQAPLSWPRAVRVVVVATAANILPLPGGALVRIHALSSPRAEEARSSDTPAGVTGAGVVRATTINLIAAVLWLSAAIGLAGAAALAHVPVIGLLALAGGLAGTVVASAAVRTVATRWSTSAVAGLVGVEIATTLLHAAKLYLVLLALSIPSGPTEALVIGVAGPVSAAAGVFPSGLGLAELLSALLAPLVALPAAAGFGATAVVRIIGLITTAPLAVWLGVRDVVGATPGARTDSGPTDGARTDSGPTGGARTDSGPTGGARTDSGPTDGARSDSGQAEPPRG